MEDKEKEFIKKVNIDKARNKTPMALILVIISILTYIEPLIYGDLDFGIFFELTSLLFVFIARIYMTKYDEIRAKRSIIIAMIPVGWMIIYDIIYVISYITNAEDLVFLTYEYFWGEILSILYIAVLFAINRDLSKADNPIKYKESTDWFYESYEENEKNEENEEKINKGL